MFARARSVALIAALLCSAVPMSPAVSQGLSPLARVPMDEPKATAIVMDAATGEILYNERADSLRYPASAEAAGVVVGVAVDPSGPVRAVGIAHGFDEIVDECLHRRREELLARHFTCNLPQDRVTDLRDLADGHARL